MTETGKLGFIGGMELDTTKGKIAGFEEAAKYVAEQEGKTVELLNVPYANSFSDAPKGKEFATELISQGADVFFGDASAVDSGAREAIDAANAAAGEIKIYDIEMCIRDSSGPSLSRCFRSCWRLSLAGSSWPRWARIRSSQSNTCSRARSALRPASARRWPRRRP